MVYLQELLVIALIFLVVGAILYVVGVDLQAGPLSLVEVLIGIGIIAIIVWFILYLFKIIVNR